MPHEIFKRPQAERDIEECFVFIAEDNLDTGVYFLAAIEDSLEQIAKFPLIGKQRGFADKQFQNVRMWRVKGFESYLIFYAVTENQIEMIRLLHSSRDIEDLFS
jgi:toxin ParE1/3/4